MKQDGKAARHAALDSLCDHLFRHQAGRMTAALVRILGPHRIELVEDVVQDALVTALDRWPFEGVPARPEAWLVRVARNRAVDRIRREAWRVEVEDELERWAASEDGREEPDERLDDVLRMMFACCRPELPGPARVALTLQAVSGFGSDEIARAFLARREAVQQRIVRAKRVLRESEEPFEVPSGDELEARLDAVLEAVYAILGEGHTASEGDELVRRDLLDEGLRLVSLLAAHPRCGRPDVHALHALASFLVARAPARLDGSGELALLADQDRTLWSRELIGAGFEALGRAKQGDFLSRYHIEAGIAACHASSARFEETDWSQIRGLYDLLARHFPTPVARLNRAVAVAMTGDFDLALAELNALDQDPSLARGHLLPAARAELLMRSGRVDEARRALEAALAHSCTGPERRLLERRLAALSG